MYDCEEETGWQPSKYSLFREKFPLKIAFRGAKLKARSEDSRQVISLLASLKRIEFEIIGYKFYLRHVYK